MTTFIRLSLFSLFVSLCFLNCSKEKDPDTNNNTSTTYGGDMVFETTTIDYVETADPNDVVTENGIKKIKKGSNPDRIFKFKNEGTEPLIIKNAKGSCGCFTPDWPKEAIQPGESGEIKVKYDTNRVGAFTKTVTLTTSEEVGTRVITGKGNVAG